MANAAGSPAPIEQVQTDPLAQLRESECGAATGGQLERERQPVQALGDRDSVIDLARLEPVPSRSGQPIVEQPQRG